MKTQLVVLIFCFFRFASFSQAIDPDSNSAFQNLIEKKINYHKQTNGAYEGYRIKIHFGTDKALAKEVKARFSTSFPDITAYEEYQQPNFVIVIGDFRTKIEAYEQFKKIDAFFPGSFIIKDKIRPIAMPQKSGS